MKNGMSRFTLVGVALFSLLVTACGSDNSVSSSNGSTVGSADGSATGSSDESNAGSVGGSTVGSNSGTTIPIDELKDFMGESTVSSNEESLVVSFGTLVDDRDGQQYKTVTIGTQTWMAQNLNFSAEESRCYDDTPTNCEMYGRLYDWSTAKQVCPSGWHLPSRDEISNLLNFVDLSSSKVRGESLKSSIWGGTDKFGFSALPAGYYESIFRQFFNLGSHTYFWSSTYNYDGDRRSPYTLDITSIGASPGLHDENNGYSVRCVKDS